jgi:hypothetical protein
MNLVGACRRVARRIFGIERLRPGQETAHAALLGHGCKAAPQVLPDLPPIHAHRPIAVVRGVFGWSAGDRQDYGPPARVKTKNRSASSPPVLTEPALNSRIISRQASAGLGRSYGPARRLGSRRVGPRRGEVSSHLGT